MPPRTSSLALTAVAVAALAVVSACSGSSGPPRASTPASSSVSSNPSSASPEAGGANGSSSAPDHAQAMTAADWPTYHGTSDRAGRSSTMPAARGPLKVRESLRLNGAVYASPLVGDAITVVATENDSVYGFDQT